MNLAEIMRENNKKARNIPNQQKAKEKFNINPINTVVLEKKSNNPSQNPNAPNFNGWNIEEPTKTVNEAPVEQKLVQNPDLKKKTEEGSKFQRETKEFDLDEELEEPKQGGYYKQKGKPNNNSSYNRNHNKQDFITLYVPKTNDAKNDKDFEAKQRNNEKELDNSENNYNKYSKSNYYKNQKGSTKNYYEKTGHKQEVIYVPKSENK